MSEIRELDPQTVERIAAGEVVERPASVVKELVENAIDAGADRIEVAVEAGGTEGIRVSDDGRGMTEAELRRAVEKHTTSKITDIADLEGGVGTLGFRGEALHAIGAVSRLTITTRPHAEKHPDGPGQGTELAVEGGDVTGVDPAGCSEGTTVAVDDLFFNVPARRKYLKTEATEFAHVNTVATSYALANPDVAVALSHDGRETFATTGGGDRRETVMGVYGREVAESMVAVPGSAVPEGPLSGLTGLVSHPETNRSTREYLSTFVNGRYVTAATVREAVVDAYDTQLAPDRYPFAVVDLAVDPADVDVNVHPRKLDVRFADDEAVREQVRTAVEETLLGEGLIRSSAPRGRSAPEQTAIRPGESDPAGGRADKDEPADDATAEPDASTDPSAAGGSADRSGPADQSADTSSASRPDAGSRPGGASAGASPGTDSAADPPAPGGDRPSEASARRFRAAGEQTRLDGADPDEVTEFDRLPSMRVLGQLHDTYVVAETDDGLVLIDQHAADERVNYERLQAAFDGERTTQVLAEPVRVEVTVREAELFEAHSEALARVGFRAERVADDAVEVRTVPALVGDAADPELIREVIAAFLGGKDGAADTVEAAADELLADLACYPSVTGNTSLTDGSVVDLLAALDDCENPYACPHGRPVVIELDRGELEARFERDYPGHGG
jgi:DNA mismatch repair protein MutL